MRARHVLVAVAVVLPVTGGVIPAAAQRPLGTRSASGLTVTPVFEGWYENADGSYSISFGYFNRNLEEIIEVPVGPDNFIEPGDQNQGQPTEFHSLRHWGVFVVTVPADFGNGTIVWTLKMRGKTFSIPGSLHRDWEIDALEGEAGSGNTPPVLGFAVDGLEGAGPAGVTSGPHQVLVGEPLAVTVWARDDGRLSGNVARDGEDTPVTLTWFKHQGPGEVVFSEATAQVDVSGGSMSTIATFGAPGSYILRVRANDASGVSGAGHAQCCWTNGFVHVTVTQ